MSNFNRNILIVFAGTSLVNFFNLLYQSLIAHKLSAQEFSGFNSMLCIFMIISAPLATIQIALTKYISQFNATNQLLKIKSLLCGLFVKLSLIAAATLLISLLFSAPLMNILKINSPSCGYLLASLLALAWLIPFFNGTILGLELFNRYVYSSVASGALKLILSFLLITLGYRITGALGALLISSIIGLLILYLPLKKYFIFSKGPEVINYREVFVYLLPVALASFCFMLLVTFDMVLVKYFFSSQDSGSYSLAQMAGKIFLFLPAAISIVMFPRTSGLNAKNLDTVSTLKRSICYVGALCTAAVIIYNCFPGFILKALTGKSFVESVFLGRFFAVSMSFFALLFILITYFLSIKDLRFIKYLAAFTLLQILGIIFFHPTLVSVQLILCINSTLLFLIHLFLLFRRRMP